MMTVVAWPHWREVAAQNDHYCAATSLQSGQVNLATLEGGSCTVPEAVVTVLCTPDDDCGCLATLEGGSCTI